MSTFAGRLYALLFGWFRALATQLFDLVTGRDSFLTRLAANWLPLSIAILCFGLFMDLLVYFAKEKPHRRMALAIRSALGLDRRDEPEAEQTPEAAPVQEDPEAWLPMKLPAVDAEEEGEILSRAESIPDEALPAYPGMRYTPAAEETRRYAQPEETRRMPAVREGAAEVKPSAESVEPTAMETEQERYARELREYEEKRAAYERELVEYERQKAAYDAEQARRQAQDTEEDGAANRRRRRGNL